METGRGVRERWRKRWRCGLDFVIGDVVYQEGILEALKPQAHPDKPKNFWMTHGVVQLWVK